MFLNKLKNDVGLTTLTKISFLLVGLSLSGCGGSSDKNTPPTVNIIDVNSTYPATDTVNPSNRIFLVEANTNDVDGSIVSINWSIISGQVIELEDSDTEILRFNAPLIDSDEIDLLTLEVEVTDNKESKTTDTVDIDLNDDLIIFIPITTAKRGEKVEIKALIFGRQSKISGLSWSVSNGIDVTLLDTNTDTVTFQIPNSSDLSELTLELEVSFMDGSENQIFNAFVNLID